MDARIALPLVNFLLADVGGGLGAFLSTWLSEARAWGPGRIGTVIALGSIVGALASTPAGSVVDRLGRPRLMLGLACGLILGGTLLLLPFRAFVLVAAAEVVVALGGALGGPAITGLTLAVVGKAGFSRQEGTNNAANHAGNVTAALLIGGLSWVVGPMAAVIVLAVMAIATIAALALMDRGSIDTERMNGCKPRQRGDKRGATRALLRNHRIWALLVIVTLFQLGNSAVLPLLGQRIVAEGGGEATAWMSACVIVAQLTMVPVALGTGHLADRLGRRGLLLGAMAVVLARCGLAAVATGHLWLIPIEVLDGMAAGVFSVAAPVAMADLTYGSGRTQTAIGAMGTALAGGAAAASELGGVAAAHIGFGATFGVMAAFPVVAIVLLLLRMTGQPDQLPDDASGHSAGAGPGAASGKAAAISVAA